MKYQLEPYTTPSSRYHCPQCNDRGKTFVRYIDTETGEHLADHVGRCGRENNCGYHYKPGQYFEREGRGVIVYRPWSMANAGRSIVDRPLSIVTTGKRVFRLKSKTNHRPSTMDHGQSTHHGQSTIDNGPKTYIHPEIVNATLVKYERNNFVQYLLNTFDFDVVYQLICRYRIGTARHWKGATIFWQIDTEGFVRTGKVMLYDTATGKRVKKPFSHITWVHTLLKSEDGGRMSEDGGRMSESGSQSSDIRPPSSDFKKTSDFKLRQCLFGEHLLKQYPDKEVAIVESEKTAIMASGHNDSFIWLAAGSINNLNTEICKPLQGRTVILYPDLGAYDKWKAKARHLQAHLKGSVFTVSRLLENIANTDQRQQGYDLGDLLKTN